MLDEIVRRVEKRLEAVGMSATAASLAAGVSGDAIRNLKRASSEGLRRGISTDTLLKLAPILKTTAGWLLEGRGDESIDDPSQSVRLVGYVGAGAQAHFYAASDDPDETVAVPKEVTENTVAVEIRGESLGAIFDTWIAYYDDVRSPVTADLIGRLCVVGLPDERVLIKQLKRSRTAGLFHLISPIEPPILDVEVAWAARVKQLSPRG